MAEHGVGEGIGKAVLDGIQQVGMKAAELAGKAIGGAVSGLGALLAAIPGMDSIGSAIASIGARGAKADMDDGHSPSSGVSAPTIAKARVQENDYEPITSKVREMGIAAAPTLAIASSMQNYSFGDLGSLSPASSPNLIGQSRGMGGFALG